MNGVRLDGGAYLTSPVNIYMLEVSFDISCLPSSIFRPVVSEPSDRTTYTPTGKGSGRCKNAFLYIVRESLFKICGALALFCYY